MVMSSSYGPFQSNDICLLDLPFLPHLKPIASASSATAVPHVAVPGPTSLPGGLIVCTLYQYKILILLSLSLVMGTEEGDEHLYHHPVCEVCHREFDDIHELSKHVNQEHRNQDRAV